MYAYYYNDECTHRVLPGTITPFEQHMVMVMKLVKSEYLSTSQASDFLGLSKQFLEISRHKGDGPPYVKLARLVKYRRSDLDKWMANHIRHNTGEDVK